MTTGYDGINNKKRSLIRKSLDGSTFVAETSADPITLTNLFDATSGALKNPLPAGYFDMGWITDAGSKLARAIKASDIMGFGSNAPLRSDITSDITTVAVECEEENATTIALWTGKTLGSIAPGANHSFSVQNPPVPVSRYYRILTLVVDLTDDGEVVFAVNMPNAKIIGFGDQILANGAAARTFPLTIQAYEDEDLGFDVERMWGGEGLGALETDMGFSEAVTISTTSASPNVTVTTGSVFEDQEGHVIAAAGITVGTTILEVTDPTHLTLSANATATGAGVAAVIAP